MSKSGLPRIDGLFEGALVVAPVGPGDRDKESVGAIQDLLRGQGGPPCRARLRLDPANGPVFTAGGGGE
jgi:hypothetical protein